MYTLGHTIAIYSHLSLKKGQQRKGKFSVLLFSISTSVRYCLEPLATHITVTKIQRFVAQHFLIRV